MPFPVQQIVFQEMLEVISDTTARLDRYDQEIERAVPGWRLGVSSASLDESARHGAAPRGHAGGRTGRLQPLRTSGQLMGYLGLVPSEHTTGNDRQQGGITKMGNAPARRALVEAAWQYRAPARLSPHLKKRQEGLPKAITDISWEAQRRLHHATPI